ncbi:hypothetical protein ACOV2X_000828 [Enterobacter roggenkampii]
MVINMKGLIVLTLALLPALATAGQITMTNPQEEQTENGKTLCPYAKTFNTEDSEE